MRIPINLYTSLCEEIAFTFFSIDLQIYLKDIVFFMRLREVDYASSGLIVFKLGDVGRICRVY